MGQTQSRGEQIFDGSVKPIDLDLSGATAKDPIISADSIIINDSTAPTTPKRVTVSALNSYLSGLFVTLDGIQSITALKTFTKDKFAMKGTSTGINTISVENTSANSYTNTIPAKDGTFAMLSDLTGFEPALGNPSVTGYVLSSTTAGVRSWVPMSGSGVYVAIAGDTMTGALTLPKAILSTSYTPTGTETTGSIWWDATDGTANLKLIGDVTLQLGQEMHFYGKAVGAISNGDLVQFAGTVGTNALIKKVVAAEIIAAPHLLMGVATENIANNEFGYVTAFGKVNDVFTTGWTAGDLLYLDKTTGQLTNVKPSPPDRVIIVAAVLKLATGASENGTILVRPTYSQKLMDLDDVDGTPLNTTGQILVWNNTAGYWDPTSNISDFQPKTTNLTSLSGLTYASASFVKMTAAGTFSLDTNTYLTAVTAHDLLSSTHGDTTAASVVRGDVITGQGTTAKWTRLALDTVGKVLISDGTDLIYSASALGSAAYAATSAFQAPLSGTGIVKSTAGTISYLTDNSTNWNNVADTYIASNFATGFEHTYDENDTPDSTLSFNTGTKIFSIAPVGASFNVYSNGTKFSKTTETVNLSSGWISNTLYYLYFTNAGVLSYSTTDWDISSDNISICTIFWNGTSSSPIIGEERHSFKRTSKWHEWVHENIGSQIRSADFGLTTITSSSTVIASGVLSDEDIHFPISIQTDSLLIVYSSGSGITYDSTLSAVSAKINAGALQYDNAGTLTNVTDGYFVRNFIMVTNSSFGPITCRISQGQYLNINDARDSNPPTSLAGIANESREIYSVIWQNIGGTPTFIESTDFRNSATKPDGLPAKTPMFLGSLTDVLIPTPSVDDILKWNGFNWVNGTGVSQSAGPGIEFYNCTPVINSRTLPAGLIQNGTSGNGILIASLSKTPVTTAEQLISGLSVNDTRPYVAWLYDNPIGRTTIDAGTWEFTIYASVSSVTGRTTTNTRQLYQVVPVSSGSITITGAGANSRTATITSSQFTGAYFAANAINTIASFIQTPSGIYQITAVASVNSVTITVPTGYVNETGVTFNLWNKLFGSTSPTITSTGTNYARYNHTSVQGAFTVAATDKLGQMGFVTSNNTTTVFVTYNGTARNSHFQTPLVTLHNNLAGLQGGASNDYVHLTTAQATIATQAASSTLSGYLSTTDWNTFNSKQASHANLTSLSGLTYASASFVKMTGANLFTLDTNIYLTSVTAHNLLSSTHGDTLADTVARGDVLIGNSTPKWARLGKGANGTVLTSDGTDVSWQTPAAAGSNPGGILYLYNNYGGF